MEQGCLWRSKNVFGDLRMVKIDVISENERLDNKVETGLLKKTEISFSCQGWEGCLSV